MFALPDQSQLAGQGAGARIALTLVGLASANAQGHYTVGALPAAIMKSNGRHGYVNLQVIAVSGGREAGAIYSVAPTRSAWKVQGTTKSAPTLSFDFATRTAYGTGGRVALQPSAETRGLVQLRQHADFAAQSVTPNLSGCYMIPGAIHYNITEHFMTTETQSSIPETVTEGTSSTHTLGVAFDSGKWGADGTLSITHSSSNSVSATYNYPRTIYNRVNYRDYANNCQSGTWREPYYLTVSAQAGYSKSVQLTYKFNHSGEVCGNSSSGPLSSSLVEADIY